MAIRIVRLGSARVRGEGVRLGTVRRPPRGVTKARYAADDWFDVWLPNLAPSAALVSAAKNLDGDAGWRRFVKRYESEMERPDNSRVLATLAALSRQTDFSVGCYCEDESRCHRTILARILERHGAEVVRAKP
jgi:uncharacterized protein YeaO (DUF488 family)